jgi:hypothetical protein
MTEQAPAEYQALRDTIRERGTVRLWVILAGLVAWGALAASVRFADSGGALPLVPLVVLAAAFEINFFIHTGVERIGRYVQVFYEERGGLTGWETTAMAYGARFPTGLDPLFSMVFAAAAALNFLSSVVAAVRRRGWLGIALAAHRAFSYRIVVARRLSSAQRALDLDRFRNLLSGQ